MSELLVIGIVALIVIGPKDLPEMFRQLGRMTAKMRAMAREFSNAMEQAAKETGVSDVAKDLKAVTDPKSMGLNAVKEAVDKFEKWDPIKNAAKPTRPLEPGKVVTGPLVPPPMPPMTPVATAAPVTEPAATATATVTAAPAAAPTPAIGPNTAALYEKKAAKAAILQEASDKLKALDQPAEAAKPKAKAAAKAAATPPTKAKAAPAEKSAPKAPRKKKAAEE